MESLESLRVVHAVTRALAGAASFEEVCGIAIDTVVSTLHADRASLLLLDEHGVMRFRAWRGLSEAYRQATEGHSPWAQDDPAADVITMSDLEREQGLGALKDVVLGEGIRALAFVPLSCGHRLLGKFMVYFDRPHVFGEVELCLARIVAEQLGFALARFRAEDRAHEIGQELRAVLDARRFLLELGDLLSTSLDIEATLSNIAKLAVPRLADWCAVELLREDGRVQAVAIEHRDPAKVALGVRLLAEYPPPPDARGAASYVHRTGEAMLIAEMTPEMLSAFARDEEHLRLLRAVALRTCIVVPLKAHGRVVGVLSLANSESDRAFDEEDVKIARQVGERAGVAMENAQLFGGIRAAQEKLELAMEAGRMGHWEYAVQGEKVWWSPAVEALHGMAPGAFDGTFAGFVRDIFPDDQDRVVATIRSAMEGDGRLEVEYRIRRPDGAIRWVEGRGRVYMDDDGRIQRLAGFCMDISDRKEAEQALDAERERLSVTLASIGEAVIATDRTGAVTLMNGVAEALTGWSCAEARGRPLLDVFPSFSGSTGLPAQNPVEEVLRTGRIVGLAKRTVLLARDGTRRSIADSAAPIRDGAGVCVGVVLVFRDVTQEERLEREMAKASKLESIGVLAGGIAHDFNNLLTSITANVSLAEHRLALDHPARPRMTAALAACDRTRDITRQLLTFAQGGAPVKAATSLSVVLREACGFALQGSNVRAQFVFGDPLDAIDADAGQIGQVVHNLVLNAAQSMPRGGRLAVVAENVQVDGASWPPLAPGPYVRFAVADEGPGIPADLLPRIFDPFYTTKPEGTGLGLATSFSIVHRHGGHIGVESPAEGGAVFTVYLPASAAAPLPREAPSATPFGKGRVLVMDDDPAILELVGECLRELGYEPDFAADGSVAIERYVGARAAGVAHDLLIMDLTVPGGLGGRETLARLREQFPDVRAVVSSGYSHDPVMARYRDHGFVGAIRKPYALSELARVLQDAFAGRA